MLNQFTIRNPRFGLTILQEGAHCSTNQSSVWQSICWVMYPTIIATSIFGIKLQFI